MTFVPKTRLSARSRQVSLAQPPSCGALVKGALEPSGSGPYVEAIREWIERVTPRDLPRPQLTLCR